MVIESLATTLSVVAGLAPNRRGAAGTCRAVRRGGRIRRQGAGTAAAARHVAGSRRGRRGADGPRGATDRGAGAPAAARAARHALVRELVRSCDSVIDFGAGMMQSLEALPLPDPNRPRGAPSSAPTGPTPSRSTASWRGRTSADAVPRRAPRRGREPGRGFEPLTPSLPWRCSTAELSGQRWATLASRSEPTAAANR